MPYPPNMSESDIAYVNGDHLKEGLSREDIEHLITRHLDKELDKLEKEFNVHIDARIEGSEVHELSYRSKL